MKNQYFGDVNDYRKYGLLRILQRVGGMRIAVCWMLTPDDPPEVRAKRNDGKFITYLDDDANGWHDRKLFRELRRAVKRDDRDVAVFEQSNLLPRDAVFWSEKLTDSRAARAAWFEGFWTEAAGTDLVFFDPDNGLEVKSKPLGVRGRKDSSKYLYWREVKDAAKLGHSVLVYQHFPRVKREPYIERRAAKLRSKCGVTQVIALRTSHVVFLFAPRPEHRERLEGAVAEVERRWGDEITVTHHTE
jgi:hypothetical protein